MSAEAETTDVLFETLLRLGDDSLILGQRLGEWCGHAPSVEVDLSLANMGLDLIGQATHFLGRAGEVEGKGRDGDKLAFHRDVLDFRNCWLVEQPNGDFAQTMARQFLFSTWQEMLFGHLEGSSDAFIASVAAKAVKEVRYHAELSAEWVIRLGDGTDESYRRAQAAIDDLWAYTGEMFSVDDSERELIEAGVAIDPTILLPEWLSTVSHVAREATLVLPENDWMQQGGRDGRHSEHLGHLLSELQYMQRSFPGATW